MGSSTPPPQTFAPQEYNDLLFNIKPTSSCDAIYASSMLITYSIRFPQGINEDVTWFIMTMTSAQRIAYIHEALYTYRQHRPYGTMYTMSRLTTPEQLDIYLKNYIDCLQWLVLHNTTTLYYHVLHAFIVSRIYHTKGTCPKDYSIALQYTKRYFPHTIYIEIRRKIYRKWLTYYMQKLFSITKDTQYKHKTITILGITIPLPYR